MNGERHKLQWLATINQETGDGDVVPCYVDDDGEAHIVGHELGLDCDCKPRQEPNGYGILYIHRHPA